MILNVQKKHPKKIVHHTQTAVILAHYKIDFIYGPYFAQGYFYVYTKPITYLPLGN